VTRIRYGVPMLLAAVLASAPAAAQEAAAPDNHGYFGVGLMLSTNTQSSGGGGDVTSRGGGLVLNGAGIINPGTGIGFGLNGSMDLGSRTYDDFDVTDTEFQMAFDGGVVVAELLYLSLGLQFLNQTDDASDVMRTYTVIPFGVGVLTGNEEGYMLAQLRFGGGQLSNDQNNSTEDVGYFGLRLMGQTGTANGLQFMGGLEFDSYDYSDIDFTDNLFRFFFGLGFGG
jgi:hypothetical protein